MSWITLCNLTELTEGRGKYVEMDGFQLAVFLNEGKVFAIDNTCPHAGGPLADSEIYEGCAVCPWHQWTFALATGELQGSPGVKIPTYPIRLFEHQGQTFVQADLPKY